MNGCSSDSKRDRRTRSLDQAQKESSSFDDIGYIGTRSVSLLTLVGKHGVPLYWKRPVD